MIHTDIKERIKDAMRARDQLLLDTLRGISTAFVNELVATRRPPQEILEDDKAITVLKRLVKQRKESAEQFEKGGRPELAGKERAERAIIEAYLPAAMTPEEIERIARVKQKELGVTDKSGAGKLMGAIMKEVGGAANGDDVKAVVAALLG